MLQYYYYLYAYDLVLVSITYRCRSKIGYSRMTEVGCTHNAVNGNAVSVGRRVIGTAANVAISCHLETSENNICIRISSLGSD